MLCPMTLNNPNGAQECNPDCAWVIWEDDGGGDIAGCCAAQIIAMNFIQFGAFHSVIDMPDETAGKE